jgi:putative methyltransferase
VFIVGLDVKTIHGNFLNASPKDEKYKKVEYVLVDPSCSGSGIVNRMENHLGKEFSGNFLKQIENNEQESEGQEERLSALSKFQVEVLTHALSCIDLKLIKFIFLCSSKCEESSLFYMFNS